MRENNTPLNPRLLKITISKSLFDESANHKPSEELSDVNLNNLLLDVLKKKGELENAKINWTSENEVELSTVSMMTLHHFIIEAEKLGKNVTLDRSIVVTVTDQT